MTCVWPCPGSVWSEQATKQMHWNGRTQTVSAASTKRKPSALAFGRRPSTCCKQPVKINPYATRNDGWLLVLASPLENLCVGVSGVPCFFPTKTGVMAGCTPPVSVWNHKQFVNSSKCDHILSILLIECSNLDPRGLLLGVPPALAPALALGACG